MHNTAFECVADLLEIPMELEQFKLSLFKNNKQNCMSINEELFLSIKRFRIGEIMTHLKKIN